MQNNPSTLLAESITVSLEWAKKLKEEGWSQSTAFWYIASDLDSDANKSWTLTHAEEMAGDIAVMFAPTAEEILRRLPDILEERFSLIIFRDYNREEKKQEWCLMYEHIPNRTPLYSESADSPANAAAAMWCYLAENNLLPDLITKSPHA